MSQEHALFDLLPQKSFAELRRACHIPGSPMGDTTGVSLEQGLGFTDLSRRYPGNKPGGELTPRRLGFDSVVLVAALRWALSCHNKGASNTSSHTRMIRDLSLLRWT